MCKGNDFILIRSGLEGDFFLEHEFLSVFLNAHGSLLLYAHGFHGFHGSLFAAVRSQEEHTMLNT